MSVKDTQTRIKSKIWKAIAQSDIDLSQVPKSQIEALVDIATEAALIELDADLEQSLASDKMVKSASSEDISEEKELWRGRPFLSITTQYIITNERLRISKGLFGKDREDIELIYIQDIDQSQSFSDRLLNLGDITVMSHDPSDPKIVMDDIRNPQEVHEILRRAVRNARRDSGLIYREEM